MCPHSFMFQKTVKLKWFDSQFFSYNRNTNLRSIKNDLGISNCWIQCWFFTFCIFFVVLSSFCNSKATVMQVERMLINDGLHIQSYPENLLFLKKVAYFLTVKGTLMHIWKSLHGRVHIASWKLSLLNPKNSWVIYLWRCIFLKNRLVFNIFYCFCMFVKKQFIYIGCTFLHIIFVLRQIYL